MAIGFELRTELTQHFAKKLEKAGIPFEFSGPNAMKIFLSEDKEHAIFVDFFGQDEYCQFKAKHGFKRPEIDRLYEVLVMIDDHFKEHGHHRK